MGQFLEPFFDVSDSFVWDCFVWDCFVYAPGKWYTVVSRQLA